MIGGGGVWAMVEREGATGRTALQRSLVYLVTRARTRTPLGAAEFLTASDMHGRDTYDKRVCVALDVCGLYRDLFPAEYEASCAPPFSTQREHEFYRLVQANLFPLLLSEEVPLETHLRREPNFFLPFIPLRGTQPHMWAGGCFNFQQIETSFKLAQVLSWWTGANGPGWHAVCLLFGLKDCPVPAPPVAAVGWTLFTYSCAVEESPLKYLPLAFNMIAYKTGNPWLDFPPVGYAGWEWSHEQVTKLTRAWQQAGKMTACLKALDEWIEADPQPRIARAIELWNKAAEVELRSGHAGEYIEHGTFAQTQLPGDVINEVYGEEGVPMLGAPIEQQMAALTGGIFVDGPAALLPAAEIEGE
jgi:hypothetical protein